MHGKPWEAHLRNCIGCHDARRQPITPGVGLQLVISGWKAIVKKQMDVSS